MDNIISVMKKEIIEYLNSPIAYITGIFYLVFTGIWIFFMQNFLGQNTASLRSYFGIIPIIFIILIPSLTMRLWAEEKKMGTEEILMTLPFKEYEIVLGKFLSVFVFLVVLILISFSIPLSLSPFGRFDFGQIFCEYLGVLFLGSAAISIGLFVSALSKNQITAFIMTAVVLIIMILINQVTIFMNTPPWLSKIINAISLSKHFVSFRKGLLDSRDILYFVLISASFLYLNAKVLVLKKWK